MGVAESGGVLRGQRGFEMAHDGWREGGARCEMWRKRGNTVRGIGCEEGRTEGGVYCGTLMRRCGSVMRCERCNACTVLWRIATVYCEDGVLRRGVINADSDAGV